MFSVLEREIRILKARMGAAVARAVIGAVNDALKVQRVQLSILKDEETDEDVEHFQPYGLSFVPPVGAECIALGVGGWREHTVSICAQLPGDRPVGSAAGTGGLYTTGQWRLFIDANGVVHAGSQEGADFVPLAEKVLTELKAVKADLDGMKQAHDTHTHLVSTTGSPSAQSGTAAPVTAPAPTPHTPASVACTLLKTT